MKKPRSKAPPNPLTPFNNPDPFNIDPIFANDEEWYTTEDLMRHLNISRSTLYRLRVNNALPAFKLGNIIVYPKRLINVTLLKKAIQNLKPDL